MSTNDSDGKKKRNVTLLLVSRSFRSLTLGFLAFAMPLYLHAVGLPLFLVGAYFAIATISSSVLIFLGGFLADSFGRRDILLMYSILFAVSLSIFAFARSPWIIFGTSILGLGTGSGGGVGGGAGGGPFAPIQSAIFADNTAQNERTKTFSINFAVASFSALAGSLISVLAFSQIPPHDAFADLFLIGFVFATLSVVSTLFIGRDKPSFQHSGIGEKENRKILSMPRKSAGAISKIALAGSLGSLGLGVVIPLIPLWFKLYLGASALEVSELYTVSYLVVGASFLFAERTEKFIGRVTSILLLRVLSSVVLVSLAFSPDYLIASVLFLARIATYTVTIPMRQSLSMELFSKDERASGASLTGLARRLPYGLGVSISGVLFSLGLFVTAVFAGALVSVLDPLLYYYFFRGRDHRD